MISIIINYINNTNDNRNIHYNNNGIDQMYNNNMKSIIIMI